MNSISVRKLFVLVAVMVASVICASVAFAADSRNFVSGNARFQVLTPTLVRMEYSASSKFLDAPSVVMINRANWPEVAVKTSEKDGWLELTTDGLKLRYKIGSGPFAADNLLLFWTDKSGEHSWKPGDKDEKNLGGINSALDWKDMPPMDPGLISRAGYSVVDDSGTPMWQESTKWIAPRADKDANDMYFFVYGNNYAHFFKEFVQLAGPIPMLPKWALGTAFTSRVGYSAEQIKKIAWRFRDDDIPLDQIVLDSCSSAKAIWYGYDFDLEQMPDPKGFFSWMDKNGFHVGRNEHYAPLPPADSTFETVRKGLGLPEDTKEIKHDLANQKYAEMFMDVMHKPVTDLGLSFWWMDGNPGNSMDKLDVGMWSRYIEYEGTERATGKRAFLMSRHGGLGSHRYPSFFTGDVFAQWDMLAYEVPYTVQCGNVLEAYVNHDLSGFTYPNLSPEMYIRWIQFGCFTPITRLHSVYGLRMPWEYGETGAEQVRKAFKLRYQLMPYIYTYSRVAHETGLPIVRGTYLEYPDQEPAYKMKHQYLFGKELLVAPIVESANGGVSFKDVFLPAGDDWFDYATGKIYRGGQVVSYDCPLDRIPVFVKAGSIIPMAPPMNHVNEKAVDPLTLDVYAGKPASFRLYEDDGESLDFRKSAFSWSTITFAPSAKQGDYTLTVGPSEGNFTGQVTKRRYEIRLHGLLKPDSVSVNGKTISELDANGFGIGWKYDRKTGLTAIHLTDAIPTGQKLVVDIKNPGSFEDAVMLQKTVDFRDRVRAVKHEEKMKIVIVTGMGDQSKPCRVVRETESVEWALDDMIASPKGLASTPPDFKAMTTKILKAFVETPFECSRTIPHNDKGVKELADGMVTWKFQPAELERMTSLLIGARIPAHITWDERKIQGHGWDENLKVFSKVIYDTDAIGAAQVTLQLIPPTDVMPGWGVEGPSAADNDYTVFPLRQPSGEARGTYNLRLKANISWDGGHTELTRDIEWRK